MKANRKFVQADEAVSPVIGVILMVAITVVLAAVVFVLVSDLGGDVGTAPSISWSVSQANDRATVSSAEGGTMWNHFEVRGTVAGEYNVTADAGATNTTLTTSFTRINLDQPLSGGDYISFCRDTTPGALDIELRHIDSGTVVQTFRFTAVLAC